MCPQPRDLYVSLILAFSYLSRKAQNVLHVISDLLLLILELGSGYQGVQQLAQGHTGQLQLKLEPVTKPLTPDPVYLSVTAQWPLIDQEGCDGLVVTREENGHHHKWEKAKLILGPSGYVVWKGEWAWVLYTSPRIEARSAKTLCLVKRCTVTIQRFLILLSLNLCVCVCVCASMHLCA